MAELEHDPEQAPPGIDTSRPHPARTYDYLLGGTTNFAIDRRTADAAARSWPAARTCVRENRLFLGRAVRYLAGVAGIDQFLDIGTGIPTVHNVHEVAQAIAPRSRVVYVDNDPIVLAHARALLIGAPQGRTAYLDADLRDPEKIIARARETLDFDRPIALTLMAILNYVVDQEDPAGIVRTLADALPPGSYVAASHLTAEFDPVAVGGFVAIYRAAGIPLVARDADEFERIAFGGARMVDPGVVLLSEWRPDDAGPRPSAAEVNAYGGVGRLPGG